jgi:DNA-binding winged helix-turn-helix (wHTH) protein/tetratricopeptide (TPR) repeat protein
MSTHPWGVQTTHLRIGEMSIELRRRRLLIAGVPAELPPRVFDLLLLFLAEPGVLHSRESLFSRIWPGLVVEEGSLSQAIWLLRRAMGEERKHALRTVSRSGYIFEPWAPIEVVEEPESFERAPEAPASSASISADAQTPQMRAGAPSLWSRMLVALVAATLLAAPVLWSPVELGPDAAAPATMQVRTVGVVMLDPGHAALEVDADNARHLLRDWIEFRLWGAPQWMLLSEEDLADRGADGPDRLVLISAGSVLDRKGELYVRATFSDASGTGTGRVIERSGPVARLPEMIESLTDDVVNQLAPELVQAPVPRYGLAGAAVRAYADGLRAIKARDWRAAAEALRLAMRQAPRSGIVRLHLSSVLAQQDESRESMEQLVAARGMFGPMPAPADLELELLRDQGLAVSDDDLLRLAKRHAAVGMNYPGRTDHVLTAINFLASGGRERAALRILSRPLWQQEPTSIRLSSGLQRCSLLMGLGYLDDAVPCAENMVRSTESAGARAQWLHGWARELVALAHYNRDPDRVDPRLFEQAAQVYEAGGYEIDALAMRARATLLFGTAGDDPSAEFGKLLDRARSEGIRGLEIMLLRTLAERSRESGKRDEQRRYLSEAEAAALSAGDREAQQQIAVELLMLDGNLGDVEAVERRIAQFERAPPQGEAAVVLAVTVSNLRLEQGRPRDARKALERGLSAVTEDDRHPASPLASAVLNHARAHVAMNEGLLQEAREALDGSRPGMPHYLLPMLDLSEAAHALMAGDTAGARKSVEKGLTLLEDVGDPDTRGAGIITAAAILTRLGDSERAQRLYRAALPGLADESSGSRRIHALIGMAETSAAMNDWPQSRRYAGEAGRLPLARVWVFSSRLSLLELAEALDRGDYAVARDRFAALDAGAVRADDHLVRSALALLRERIPEAERPPMIPRPTTPAFYRYEAAWLAKAVGAPARSATAAR